MLRTLQASLSLSSLFGVQTGHDVARCGAPGGTVQLHLPQSGEGLHKQVDKTHSRVLMWMYIQKSMFRPRAMMSSRCLLSFLCRVAEYGIYTLLDMHQDAYSHKLCGEGFPAWAVVTGSE